MEIYNIKNKMEFLKEVCELTEKEWGSYSDEKEFEQKVNNKIEKVKSFINNKDYCKLILVDKDELVGFVSIFPNDCVNKKELTPWYSTMYVKEKFRGNGYSKLLNTAILKVAKKRNYDKLYLKTNLDNYYEKLGAQFIEILGNGEKLYFINVPEIMQEEEGDITINVLDYVLNMRAGAIIIHNNKILLHKNEISDHYCLVGGRVQIGEDSKSTVKREVEEELGKKVEISDCLATIENFFDIKGKKYHEIFFMWKTEFENDKDKNIENTLYNIEGKDYLSYQWIPIDELNNYNILPKVVVDILKNNKFPTHKIVRDY